MYVFRSGCGPCFSRSLESTIIQCMCGNLARTNSGKQVTPFAINPDKIWSFTLVYDSISCANRNTMESFLIAQEREHAGRGASASRRTVMVAPNHARAGWPRDAARGPFMNHLSRLALSHYPGVDISIAKQAGSLYRNPMIDLE